MREFHVGKGSSVDVSEFRAECSDVNLEGG